MGHFCSWNGRRPQWRRVACHATLAGAGAAALHQPEGPATLCRRRRSLSSKRYARYRWDRPDVRPQRSSRASGSGAVHPEGAVVEMVEAYGEQRRWPTMSVIESAGFRAWHSRWACRGHSVSKMRRSTTADYGSRLGCGVIVMLIGFDTIKESSRHTRPFCSMIRAPWTLAAIDVLRRAPRQTCRERVFRVSLNLLSCLASPKGTHTQGSRVALNVSPLSNLAETSPAIKQAV